MIRTSNIALQAPLSIYINRKPYGAKMVTCGFTIADRNINIEEEVDHPFHVRDNLEIAVPDVITIDEEIYNKLYLADFSLPAKRLRTFLADDEFVDYDVDQEDENWLEKQPRAWKLTADNFEKAIQFLEIRSTNEVPSLSKLVSQSIVKVDVAEAIYDYWVEKRLNGKKRLMFATKKEQKSREGRRRSLIDPFVVFRDNPDKVHTRKNRAKDNENYLKMLKLRIDMAEDLKTYTAMVLSEKHRHSILTQKFERFKTRYQGRLYEDELMEIGETCSKPILTADHVMGEEDITQSFEFQFQAGCKYFVSKEEFDYSFNDDHYELPKKFFRTSKGYIRRRFSRGGRIVYDRRLDEQYESEAEFHMIDINPSVIMSKSTNRRFTSIEPSSCSTSTFSLSNLSDEISFELETD